MSTIMVDNDRLIIQSLSDLFNNVKSLDNDISEWIDNNFWDLI